MNPQITWLASYPKSGNTWVRFIVFFLAHRRLPTASWELDQFSASRLPQSFTEAPEFCRSASSKRPEGGGRAPVFCKTHASAGALSPLYAQTRNAIYVTRNPLDVLSSALNYARLTGELAQDEDPEIWIERYVEFGGNPLWAHPDYAARNWRENVREWKACTAFPVLWLSYEELLSDPRAEIVRIASFMGYEADGSFVDECVGATSFSSLREFENREIKEALITGKSQGRFSVENRMAAASQGVRFFNRGGMGGYRGLLTAEQIGRACRMFEPEFSTLGYAAKE